MKINLFFCYGKILVIKKMDLEYVWFNTKAKKNILIYIYLNIILHNIKIYFDDIAWK